MLSSEGALLMARFSRSCSFWVAWDASQIEDSDSRSVGIIIKRIKQERTIYEAKASKGENDRCKKNIEEKLRENIQSLSERVGQYTTPNSGHKISQRIEYNRYMHKGSFRGLTSASKNFTVCKNMDGTQQQTVGPTLHRREFENSVPTEIGRLTLSNFIWRGLAVDASEPNQIDCMDGMRIQPSYLLSAGFRVDICRHRSSRLRTARMKCSDRLLQSSTWW